MLELDLNKAKCASLIDPLELFFPEGYAIKEKTEYAKAICALCPIALPCFLNKMEQDDADLHGIWGGTTPAERKSMRKNKQLLELHITNLKQQAI